MPGGFVGINNQNATKTLDVIRDIKAIIYINTGGYISDFLVKSDVSGKVGYRIGNNLRRQWADYISIT